MVVQRMEYCDELLDKNEAFFQILFIETWLLSITLALLFFSLELYRAC